MFRWDTLQQKYYKKSTTDKADETSRQTNEPAHTAHTEGHPGQENSQQNEYGLMQQYCTCSSMLVSSSLMFRRYSLSARRATCLHAGMRATYGCAASASAAARAASTLLVSPMMGAPPNEFRSSVDGGPDVTLSAAGLPCTVWESGRHVLESGLV